jgi:molybdopterin-guanine dinucleotide biosynthesis protein A
VTCAGVLLTGGASRRMATDKANIVWRGETLAARAARVLGAACDPVIEVGSGATGLRCVREDPPGSGPLAALLAGWPGRPTVIPVADGRPQYACARYGPYALERAGTALAAGDHALRAMHGDDCDELTEPHWRAVAAANTFADVDTPTDLRLLGLS